MRQLCPFVLLLVGLALGGNPPDCSWSGRWSNRPTDQADGVTTFNTNGSTAVPGPSQNNTSTGCTAWIMIVDVEGFSAFSVELDVAPMASPGVAGAWSSATGLTTVSGSNPTTASPSTYLATGYNPFFRANVTTVTGTPGSINIQIFGWRSPAYLSAGTSLAGGGPPTFNILGTNLGSATFACNVGWTCYNNFGVFTVVTGTVVGQGRFNFTPSIPPNVEIICSFQPYDSITASYVAASPLIKYFGNGTSAYAFATSSNMANSTTYNFTYQCFSH